MKKLLWIGDAIAATGFARITHRVLEVVGKTWDVAVLGLNYMGDPHGYPYPVFPCWPGGDAFGVRRVKEVIARVRPDLIVIQNDPWNVPAYLDQIGDACPVVGALAVDGLNCKAGGHLSGLKHAIFWTEFGRQQAIAGGYTGPSSVIPLGVDLDVYKRVEGTRKALGLPEEMWRGFVVGNLNRNQPRKRLDLTIQYFAEWIRLHEIRDAFLFLQVCPTGDADGYDVRQLKKYHDPEGRAWLVVVEPDIGLGVPELLLPSVYSCFDVQLTTTQGEGWGLTTMEGMACGVPQIVPNWSGLGEWAIPAAMEVPCYDTSVTPNRINVIGGVPDRLRTVTALDWCYRDWKRQGEKLAGMRDRGLRLVSDPKYRWEAIGQAYADLFDQIPLREESV